MDISKKKIRPLPKEILPPDKDSPFIATPAMYAAAKRAVRKMGLSVDPWRQNGKAYIPPDAGGESYQAR